MDFILLTFNLKYVQALKYTVLPGSPALFLSVVSLREILVSRRKPMVLEGLYQDVRPESIKLIIC